MGVLKRFLKGDKEEGEKISAHTRSLSFSDGERECLRLLLWQLLDLPGAQRRTARRASILAPQPKRTRQPASESSSTHTDRPLRPPSRSCACRGRSCRRRSKPERADRSEGRTNAVSRLAAEGEGRLSLQRKGGEAIDEGRIGGGRRRTERRSPVSPPVEPAERTFRRVERVESWVLSAGERGVARVGGRDDGAFVEGFDFGAVLSCEAGVAQELGERGLRDMRVGRAGTETGRGGLLCSEEEGRGKGKEVIQLGRGGSEGGESGGEHFVQRFTEGEST